MKRHIALCLCAALVLCLCGCGSSGGEYVPTGDALEWDEDYTGPTYTQPREEEPQELTLTYYPGQSMNPYVCTEATNRALFSLMYQSLFVVDRDYNVQPLLCSRYSISGDLKTYTFYIEDATFSDGSKLNAQDVMDSLKAAMKSDVYKGRFYRVADISLTGDGGITIQLDTPYENFLLLLDVPILQSEQVNADRPLGTGPYTLDESGSTAVLRRRTDWWCNIDLAVTASTIALLTAESITQIRDAFQFADLDLVCADPGSDRYADYRSDFELWDCENGIFLYLACNSRSAVFSNGTVRTALTYAIDRETLVDNYYRGFARAATLPASPLSPYYNPSLAAKYSYDSAKFAQAVKDANLTGSSVVLLVNQDDSLRLRVARAIGDMLESCGLSVEMKELSGNDYLYALNSRSYDLYLGQTMLSANMDLSAFFSSNGSLSAGGINDVTAYALCLQALENHGNYYTLHQTVMENGLLCPVLFRSYAVYATRGKLTDLTPARDNIFYYSLGKTLEDTLITE